MDVSKMMHIKESVRSTNSFFLFGKFSFNDFIMHLLSNNYFIIKFDLYLQIVTNYFCFMIIFVKNLGKSIDKVSVIII